MSTLTFSKSKRSIRKISTDEMKKMREKDHKMVSGIFRCYEPRGGEKTFSFLKYKGDEILKYRMIDGEHLDVPYMVAKHLNNECYIERHAHILDANGNTTIGLGKKIHSCSFESLEFQEIEEKKIAS